MPSAVPGSMKPINPPVLDPEQLPSRPLYGDEGRTGWELSPEPFCLTPDQLSEIHRLGQVLWRFVQACDRLYRDSLQGHAPAWVSGLMDQGKPESLLKFSAMKRFRAKLPQVIRPDLLLTDEGFMLTEIDAVPGGIGFTAALNRAYRNSGFGVVEAKPSMESSFLAMLKAQVPDCERPVIAVTVSDEAADYRQELAWLVSAIQSHYPEIHLVHPKDLALVRDRLVFDTPAGEKPVDLIYRFFELFDLPNIPRIELIQYAVKKGITACTPPFKPHLEEKSWLCLVHHPALNAYWKQALGDDHDWLKARIPLGWVMDPAQASPQGVIPGLTLRGNAVQQFQDLVGLSQKERQLVIKPSGFSPLAWGSRGVVIGHDVSADAWDESLHNALKAFPESPHILQQFHKPASRPARQVELHSGAISDFQGRTRLCPYFFVSGDEPDLAGILATTCPADKKIIHGMRDAVMAPCMIRE